MKMLAAYKNGAKKWMNKIKNKTKIIREFEREQLNDYNLQRRKIMEQKLSEKWKKSKLKSEQVRFLTVSLKLARSICNFDFAVF
jgi:hypothetical protein